MSLWLGSGIFSSFLALSSCLKMIFIQVVKFWRYCEREACFSAEFTRDTVRLQEGKKQRNTESRRIIIFFESGSCLSYYEILLHKYFLWSSCIPILLKLMWLQFLTLVTKCSTISIIKLYCRIPTKRISLGSPCEMLSER